jgi:hypothetical protein
MVEKMWTYKRVEYEDEQGQPPGDQFPWLAAPAPVAQIRAWRSISTPTSNGDAISFRGNETFDFKFRFGIPAGTKGVPQVQRAAKPFSPGLGYEPEKLSPNKPGSIDAVRLGVYEATWPRTRPGPNRAWRKACFLLVWRSNFLSGCVLEVGFRWRRTWRPRIGQVILAVNCAESLKYNVTLFSFVLYLTSTVALAKAGAVFTPLKVFAIN